jgi:hypothetical protein
MILDDRLYAAFAHVEAFDALPLQQVLAVPVLRKLLLMEETGNWPNAVASATGTDLGAMKGGSSGATYR